MATARARLVVGWKATAVTAVEACNVGGGSAGGIWCGIIVDGVTRVGGTSHGYAVIRQDMCFPRFQSTFRTQFLLAAVFLIVTL